MAHPVVALFGYESSTFTSKIRHVLRLKQIPYHFVPVPTMMPRPLLKDNFHLTYRKIPVLAIGRDLYCDSSIICEALEHHFPKSEGYGSLYPAAADGRTYRSLIRGFASYWTDRPLFRVTCGLMGATNIWRTQFGVDRAQLIGHKLDPDKLEKKVPESLSNLDTQLSLFEPLLADTGGPWIFSTPTPSLADIAVYYELLWGELISSGRYSDNITEGELHEEKTNESPMAQVFNPERYPAVHAWYFRMRDHFDELPEIEDKDIGVEHVLEQIKKSSPSRSLLLPTPRPTHAELDAKTGLQQGKVVSVAPNDTGRDDPTIGELLAISPEEVVIKPKENPPIETAIHFPRIGFVVRPVKETASL